MLCKEERSREEESEMVSGRGKETMINTWKEDKKRSWRDSNKYIKALSTKQRMPNYKTKKTHL